MHVRGLILQHTGVEGQFQRLGLLFSESTNLQIDYTALVAAHRPALASAHYEVYHDEDGHSTITII
jgi:hypothetical protein